MNGATVLVRCVKCRAERTIAPGEIGADDFPMCDTCYSPMMPVKAVAR